MSTTLDRATPLTSLQRDIDVAINRAVRSGQPVPFSHAEPLSVVADPLSFLRAGSAELGDGVLWSQPASGCAFAGAGAALVITAEGPGRFRSVSSAIGSLQQRLVDRHSDFEFPVIGGFAFDDGAAPAPPWDGFPHARFVVPAVLLQVHPRQTYLRLTLHVQPADTVSGVTDRLQELKDQGRSWLDCTDHPRAQNGIACRQSLPNRQQWESAVAEAVTMIRRGSMDKVVLAREERLCADHPFLVWEALRRLRKSDSSVTVFAMQSGPSWFIGGSPERLVRLRDGRVDVSCLAGSISAGSDPEERELLAGKLLASGKDREEHEIVVRSTLAALREVCDTVVRLSGTPRVVTARSVQHLESPLVGQMPSSGNVLALAERLHPTPAVGGHPRSDALAAIRHLEAIERGWYAGPFGWVDLSGAGEFIVAIRSALVSGNMASLFAGCGIVEGSLPADEFAETEIKLRSMLAALDGS